MTTSTHAAPTTEAHPESSAALMEMIFGFQRTHAIHVAASLEIADLLSHGPKTVEQLAEATDTRGPLLYRLLRALAGLGIFAERSDGRFEMTPLAEPLLTDAPGGSARGYALLAGQPFAQRPWEELLWAVRTGGTAFDRIHGMPLFEFLANDTEANAVFNGAMTSHTSREAEAIVRAYEFGESDTIVDIAGGHGALLTSILDAKPAARGVLLELPHVISGAMGTVRAANVDDRCSLVEGDMFASVPAGGDAYILKRVLHDWEDQEAAAIVGNCRQAMNDNGHVLGIDQVIPAGNHPHPAKFYDLMMLLVVGGRERTETDFGRLFATAGLELTRIIPTRSPLSIIEGTTA